MAQEPTSACHPSSPAEEFFLLPREIALPFPPLLLTPPHTVPTCRQVPCSSCPSCLSSHLGCPTPDPAPPSLPVLAAGSLLLGFSVMLEARHPGLRTCRASRRTTAGLPGLGVLGEGAALRLSVEGTLSPKDFEGSPMDTSFVHSCPSPTFVLPLGTASACPCLLGSRAPTPSNRRSLLSPLRRTYWVPGITFTQRLGIRGRGTPSPLRNLMPIHECLPGDG